METETMTEAVRALPKRDKALLGTLIALALAALTIGVFAGLATALVRAGAITAEAEVGYRGLTIHGFTIFFYWLYAAQAAALLALVTAEAGGAGMALRPAAWMGAALMSLGFVLQQAGAWSGAPLLYDGSPEAAIDEPAAAAPFFAGYLLLGLGLLLIAATAIATALRAKTSRPPRPWSSIGFGAVGWAGLVMVSSIAMAMTFLPAFLWSLGWGEEPARQSTYWHLLFHNLHYLPLMGTVLLWYAMAHDLTGMRSIFGQGFSKVVFASYLVFVPPTSLYHMFLEPDLAPLLRVLGSVLSLFISVPTIAAFLVIMGSLEALARERGQRGLLGWSRVLPWGEPATTAIACAVINLAIGGAFSFVLIQERFATLLSDTFFVPGYFHFLTIGTVTLTLLAAMARLVPALTGKSLAAPGLLRALPFAITVGIVIFGASGILAGISGMPRRVLDATYGGAGPSSWMTLSTGLGAGATVMAAGLLAYVCILVWTAVRRVPRVQSPVGPQASGLAIGAGSLARKAWAAPLAVVVLVAGMFAATIVTFALLDALPLLTNADGGH